MKKNINIAKILKNKPEKTILYDAMRDINVSLYVVEKQNGETNIFCDGMEKFKGCSFVYSDTGADSIFRKGMQILKPSKEMQDWEKFSWKRGDVLISSDYGFVCIFKEWASDDYTKFNGCYFDGMPNASTAKYSKLDNNTAYGYIREIENRCGGKLNLETLEIEKSEFKNGDIAFAEYGNRQNVFIVSGKTDLSEGYNSFISLDLSGLTLNIGYRTSFFKKGFCKLRLATDSEKQQLFDALAKEGKAWDAEKKQIVDLKPKVELKPFDKVLCRNSKDDTWEADFFARLTRKEIDYTQSGKYLCVGDLWMYCIPYNEETAHLLGTTDEWKGGEG